MENIWPMSTNNSRRNFTAMLFILFVFVSLIRKMHIDVIFYFSSLGSPMSCDLSIKAHDMKMVNHLLTCNKILTVVSEKLLPCHAHLFNPYKSRKKLS